MRLDSAAARSAIETNLLEYYRTPGKYALLRKQPGLLFASIKEVLQLASGRAPNGDEASAPAAQKCRGGIKPHVPLPPRQGVRPESAGLAPACGSGP